jgi:hypothetical protein
MASEAHASVLWLRTAACQVDPQALSAFHCLLNAGPSLTLATRWPMLERYGRQPEPAQLSVHLTHGMYVACALPLAGLCHDTLLTRAVS